MTVPASETTTIEATRTYLSELLAIRARFGRAVTWLEDLAAAITRSTKRVRADGPGHLVMPEAAQHGWHAPIDGHPTPLSPPTTPWSPSPSPLATNSTPTHPAAAPAPPSSCSSCWCSPPLPPPAAGTAGGGSLTAGRGPCR